MDLISLSSLAIYFPKTSKETSVLLSFMSADISLIVLEVSVSSSESLLADDAFHFLFVGLQATFTSVSVN